MTTASLDGVWRRFAACRDVDADLFFPIGATGPALVETSAAKEVCARCPVTSDCLAFALDTNQEFGIWGGLGEEERRVLRRKLRRTGHGNTDGWGLVVRRPTPVARAVIAQS